MHCEKNIYENIIKTLFGKDIPSVCINMLNKEIRPNQWLEGLHGDNTRFWVPDAPYVLSLDERRVVLENIKAVTVPFGYVSNISSRISDEELRGLKSHDHNVLLPQILPASLQHVSHPKVVGAVIRVSWVFQRLCSKVIYPAHRFEFMEDVADTTSILEKEIQPTFFDSITQLMVHLVQELHILGPIHTRWIYPYERYKKGLKGLVKNLAKPKGTIAKAYEVEEALGFVTEYMAAYTPISRRVWDSAEDQTMLDEIVEGKGKPRALSERLRAQMHAFVPDNAERLEPYHV